MPKMTPNNICWTVNQWVLFPDMCSKLSLHTLIGSIETTRDFCYLLYGSLKVLRDNALNGKADTWLDTPALYESLASLRGAEEIVLNTKEDIKIIIKIVKSWHNNRIDHEMWYCVEDDFLKGMHKALLRKHEDHLLEKKRRFEVWHEDLIAATLHPERVVRMATRFGLDAIDYLEAI